MWTEEETAVLLIFAMWGYKHEAIAEILTNRRAEIRGIFRTDMQPSYTRTVSAVRNKLAEVRSQNSQLWSKDEGWARDAVLEHLYGSLVDHAHVKRLLNLTPSDVKIITRVWTPTFLKEPYKLIIADIYKTVNPPRSFLVFKIDGAILKFEYTDKDASIPGRDMLGFARNQCIDIQQPWNAFKKTAPYS